MHWLRLSVGVLASSLLFSFWSITCKAMNFDDLFKITCLQSFQNEVKARELDDYELHITLDSIKPYMNYILTGDIEYLGGDLDTFIASFEETPVQYYVVSLDDEAVIHQSYIPFNVDNNNKLIIRFNSQTMYNFVGKYVSLAAEGNAEDVLSSGDICDLYYQGIIMTYGNFTPYKMIESKCSLLSVKINLSDITRESQLRVCNRQLLHGFSFGTPYAVVQDSNGVYYNIWKFDIGYIQSDGNTMIICTMDYPTDVISIAETYAYNLYLESLVVEEPEDQEELDELDTELDSVENILEQDTINVKSFEEESHENKKENS